LQKSKKVTSHKKENFSKKQRSKEAKKRLHIKKEFLQKSKEAKKQRST
jgi:hypothetical protein